MAMEFMNNGSPAEVPEGDERLMPPAADQGWPAGREFPPNERNLLDDDFFEAYGRDPDEYL